MTLAMCSRMAASAGVRVAGADRLDDAFVLRQRDGGPAGQQRHRELVTHELAVQPGEDALGRRVGADRSDEVVQAVVEAAVARNSPASTARRMSTPTSSSSIACSSVTRRAACAATRPSSTMRTCGDLHGLGQRHLADVRALVALHLHQPLGREVLQGRAHHEPADPEPFAQRRLHEALAGENSPLRIAVRNAALAGNESLLGAARRDTGRRWLLPGIAPLASTTLLPRPLAGSRKC
jgi:hypothetical protein